MSGITLKSVADTTIPTPPTDKSTLFFDVATGEPSYKDDAGTVVSLVGIPGAGVPAGGTTGQVLKKIDGTDYNTEWATPGSGDVVGPAASVDGHVVLFDGADGKLLKDGGVPAVDRSTVTAVTPASGTATFDYSLGDYFTLAPTANVTTLDFSNLPGAGHGASLMIRFTQDTTPRTVAWPASFKWAGGVAPSVSTGSGAVDVLAITTFDNGTTWRATLAKAFA